MIEPQLSPASSQRRRNMMIGMLILAALILLVALWRLFGHAQDNAAGNESVFAALKPDVVAIAGSTAPAITGDDVAGAFYALDAKDPAAIAKDTARAFDIHAPQQVWLLADASWASDPAGADLGKLLADLKARNIPALLILPPQQGETDDAVIDTLAELSHENDATFLDYHDASKLASVDCPTDASASDLTVQKMLLQMGINAPATREYLRLADIAARIETLEAEKGCGSAVEEAPADDPHAETAPPAE